MPDLSGIVQVAEAVRSGRRKAVDVVRESLERIEAAQPALGAFITVTAKRAIERAGRVDEAAARGEDVGPLAGVPIAVKDNICTRAGRTTCGSRILEGFGAGYDAHVVARLESAGAVIVGKTNLDEFAMGSSTENSAFFPARNPWDVTRVPGGSSGGSAVGVAAGLVPASLGSDTGGSIRQPAAFCGVVGLMPTYGRVSRYGLVAFGSSLDQIGPITRSVRDAAVVLSVIAGHDPRDSTSVREAVPDYAARLNRPLKGLRIGVRDDDFGAGVDPAVAERVRAAVDMLASEGAAIVPVELPHLKYAVACYYIVAPAEASSNLARFDGMRYGYRSPRAEHVEGVYSATRGEGFGAEVKRRIMLGTHALSSGYYDAYYLKALSVRTLIKQDFERAFEKVDVIASPVAPTTAFRLGEKAQDPLAMYLGDVYTISANLAGLCAMSVPAGFDGEGLPIGLQLTGPAFGEETVLAIGHQYQRLTDHHLRTAPSSAPNGQGEA